MRMRGGCGNNVHMHAHVYVRGTNTNTWHICSDIDCLRILAPIASTYACVHAHIKQLALHADTSMHCNCNWVHAYVQKWFNMKPCMVSIRDTGKAITSNLTIVCNCTKNLDRHHTKYVRIKVGNLHIDWAIMEFEIARTPHWACSLGKLRLQTFEFYRRVHSLANKQHARQGKLTKKTIACHGMRT